MKGYFKASNGHEAKFETFESDDPDDVIWAFGVCRRHAIEMGGTVSVSSRPNLQRRRYGKYFDLLTVTPVIGERCPIASMAEGLQCASTPGSESEAA